MGASAPSEMLGQGTACATLGTSTGKNDVKILLADDEPSCRIATAMLLEHLGFAVEAVANGDQALARFEEGVHEIVITDEHMPGLSGRDLATALKRRSPSTPVVMYTASVHLTLDCADAWIVKPASISDFRETLSAVIRPRTAKSGCESDPLTLRVPESLGALDSP